MIIFLYRVVILLYRDRGTAPFTFLISIVRHQMRSWQLGFLFPLLGQRSWLRSQWFYDKERGVDSSDSFINVG